MAKRARVPSTTTRLDVRAVLEGCDDCGGPLCPACGEHLGVCPDCLAEFTCEACEWTAPVEAFGFAVVDERQTVNRG